MRRTALLLLPFAPVLLASPATAQPQPTVGVSGGAARPWVSPPGWLGPGPAWHKYADPGPGNGWQYYNVPNGPYVFNPPVRNYWGPGVGPGWWGIPAATRSFWTNGRSLYGPPVPTYGPTPGVFGAHDDDKRFFGNPPPANGVWFGLGWGGYRSPSPRGVPQTVSVWPPVGPGGGPSVQVLDAPPVVAGGGACLRLAVRLPDANADVWVEKTEMTQKGTDRVFTSPPLADGQSYKYEVVARWTENGRDRAESRTVVGKPGQTIGVDFTKPDDGLANAK